MIVSTLIGSVALAQSALDPFVDICEFDHWAPSTDECNEVPLHVCHDLGVHGSRDWIVTQLPALAGLEVKGAAYTLLDGDADGRDCDPELDQIAMLYVRNSVTLATQILHTFDVAGLPGGGFVELELDTSFVMGVADELWLAVRSADSPVDACTSGGPLTCLLGCSSTGLASFVSFGEQTEPHFLGTGLSAFVNTAVLTPVCAPSDDGGNF
ncbi:MAG: hypothetical protein KTR31_18870 [Myxococcales bacterium]|nr:hypothetical protein [Myxococcales bacterium]